jgi:hypothetical protein
MKNIKIQLSFEFDKAFDSKYLLYSIRAKII